MHLGAQFGNDLLKSLSIEHANRIRERSQRRPEIRAPASAPGSSCAPHECVPISPLLLSRDHHIHRLSTVDIRLVIHAIAKVIGDPADHDRLAARGQIVIVVIGRVADQK